MSLDALFNPRSVAVIGASRDPRKISGWVMRNLVEGGFAGPIHPVNPAGGEILGRPVAPDVAAIGSPVDLAVITVPRARAAEAVRACAAARVQVAVILSSGFGEASGGDGTALQQELVATARAGGLRLLGPNCMGVFSAGAGLNASYFWDLPRVPGRIAFVSQSGAYGGMFFAEVRARGIGVTKFASIGNQVDIRHQEVMAWLAEDPETAVIACFVEEMKDGPEFLRVLRDTARKKPVVILKAGRTEAGRRAAASHTGSLAGSREAVLAALRQAGALVARTTEEFFDVAMALDWYGDRLPANDRVAIMTVSGGPCVIASDAAEEQGLAVPPLREAVRETLRRHLPFFAALGNPVDMTPQCEPDRYAACVDAVLAEPEIGGCLALNCGLDSAAFGQAFAAAEARHGKPVVAFTLATPEVDRVFREHRIAVFPAPERAVHAYRGLLEYARVRARRGGAALAPAPPSAVLAALAPPAGAVLDEVAGKAILREYGIPACREAVARDEAEAARCAAALGFPVVVKVCLEGLGHKSDRGGVVLGLRDEAAVRRAAQELRRRFGPGVRLLVQEQVPDGVELILGARRDPQLGPVVAVGLGGVFAEALRDVALRVAPLTVEDALEALDELRGAPVLRGARGRPGVAREPVARAMAALGQLMLANPQVAELDINPLIGAGDRLVAVDALVVLAGAAADAPGPPRHGTVEGNGR